jgi:hypothetical protein
MEYDGVAIDWIRGKRAVLTIYDEDGNQIKDVPLYELKTRKDMHQLMIDEGFHKKTQQQKVEEIQVERREIQLEQISDGGPSSFYNTITGLYVMVFVVLAGKLRKKFKEKIMYAKEMSRRRRYYDSAQSYDVVVLIFHGNKAYVESE